MGNEQVGSFLVVKFLDQLIICSVEVFGSLDYLLVGLLLFFLVVLVVVRVFLLRLFFASFSVVYGILTILVIALLFIALSVVYLVQRHLYQVCACSSEAI